MCGIRVLSAVFRARPQGEEELVQVPVAVLGERVAEGQPRFHHANFVIALDAALHAEARSRLDVPAGGMWACG